MKDVQSALTYLQRPLEIFLSQPQGFPYTFHTLGGGGGGGTSKALMLDSYIDIMGGPNFDSSYHKLKVFLLLLVLL